jgi:hypothetical protein
MQPCDFFDQTTACRRTLYHSTSIGFGSGFGGAPARSERWGKTSGGEQELTVDCRSLLAAAKRQLALPSGGRRPRRSSARVQRWLQGFSSTLGRQLFLAKKLAILHSCRASRRVRDCTVRKNRRPAEAAPDLALWQPGTGLRPKPTDGERVTLAVMQVLLGYTSESPLYQPCPRSPTAPVPASCSASLL